MRAFVENAPRELEHALLLSNSNMHCSPQSLTGALLPSNSYMRTFQPLTSRGLGFRGRICLRGLHVHRGCMCLRGAVGAVGRRELAGSSGKEGVVATTALVECAWLTWGGGQEGVGASGSKALWQDVGASLLFQLGRVCPYIPFCFRLFLSIHHLFPSIHLLVLSLSMTGILEPCTGSLSHSAMDRDCHLHDLTCSRDLAGTYQLCF